MSLILEALRKLEREKDVPARGFLVLPPPKVAPRSGRILGPLSILALVGLVLLVWRSSPQAPAPVVAPLAPTSVARAPQPPSPRPTPAARVPSTESAEPPVFVLQAITQRDGKPVAVLNEHVVQEGDLLEGARIVAIGIDSVELEFRGRRQTVRF